MTHIRMSIAEGCVLGSKSRGPINNFPKVICYEDMSTLKLLTELCRMNGFKK
jgi:hypothetical protein